MRVRVRVELMWVSFVRVGVAAAAARHHPG